ncbi:MAG: hypothetical protein LBB76_09775 [Azoarcus sp.]|jgi:hypothetical protein|nr:hypothetical protein [Azoarcus sp.]
MKRIILLLPLAALMTSCAWLRENDVEVAAGVGGYVALSKLGATPEIIAGGLIAYAMYDPFSPQWSIRVVEIDHERRRIELRMKRFSTGGDGEARQVFMRVARQLAEEGGDDGMAYAGFDELRYEEGIESSRPLAQRVADGEIRLVKSRQFPQL